VIKAPRHLAADVTVKCDVCLRWHAPPAPPYQLQGYEVRTDTKFGNEQNLLGRTMLTRYLVIDPSLQTTVYYVAAISVGGIYGKYAAVEVSEDRWRTK
jgi:hypothetical protein